MWALLFLGCTLDLSAHIDKKQQIQYYGVTVINKIQQNSTRGSS